MIRKFYSPEAAEQAAAVIEQEQSQFNSIAEAMAKVGKKSDENSMVTREIPPVAIKVETEENKGDGGDKAATAEKPESQEAKAVETESPKKEEAKVEVPKTESQQKPQLTLDEVLKNEQPDTILKKLGFNDEAASILAELKEYDPKVAGIVKAYKEGTLGDYLKELSVDYTKMPAEEVMRNQLRREYPKASEEALQALYESEIVEKYKLDPDIFTEDEIRKGRLLLEAKAEKFRDEFVANQQKFLLPEKPQPKAEQGASPEELQKEQIKAYREEISSNPYTKDIIANKKITIGDGDEKFSYPVEPEALLDVLADPNKWVEVMYDKEIGADGQEHYTPKVEHQLLVAAFSQDSKKFLSEYAKHLKSLGAKQVIDPIENASSPDKSTPAKGQTEFKSVAEAMAKMGRKSG